MTNLNDLVHEKIGKETCTGCGNDRNIVAYHPTEDEGFCEDCLSAIESNITECPLCCEYVKKQSITTVLPQGDEYFEIWLRGQGFNTKSQVCSFCMADLEKDYHDHSTEGDFWGDRL